MYTICAINRDSSHESYNFFWEKFDEIKGTPLIVTLIIFFRKNVMV
jgi:hypothetical protein